MNGASNMTLGQKIKEARLERNMTQKEVVGDYITRNMLSKIENDSATPSVKTLEYLASALGLPAGYFMSDTGGDELTPEAVDRARAAYRDRDYQTALELLDGVDIEGSGYADEVLLLKSYAAYALAKKKLEDGLSSMAQSLAEDAVYYNQKSMYSFPAFKTEVFLFIAKCRLAIGDGFDEAIAEYHEAYRDQGLGEMYRLMMTDYFIHLGDTDAAADQMEQIMKISAGFEPEYLMLKAKLELRRSNYLTAVTQLRQAEELSEGSGSHQFMSGLYAMLEECYKELDDFKMAYHYATKQLQMK